MWFVVGHGAYHGMVWPLVPGRTVTVGRRGTDLAFTSDKTVSRTHLSLHALQHSYIWDTAQEFLPQVNLQDENSTSGTTVNGEPVGKGEKLTLKQSTNTVLVGRESSSFSVVHLPVFVTVHKLPQEDKTALEEHARRTGLILLNNWEPTRSTHLCTARLEVKGRKLFECLTSACHVVTVQWAAQIWKQTCSSNQAQTAVQGVLSSDTTEAVVRKWFPEEGLYLPPPVEPTTFNFSPNPRRRHVFDGMLLILFNEEYERMAAIVRSGGGEAEHAVIDVDTCLSADVVHLLDDIQNQHRSGSRKLAVLIDNVERIPIILRVVNERRLPSVTSSTIADVILRADVSFAQTLASTRSTDTASSLSVSSAASSSSAPIPDSIAVVVPVVKPPTAAASALPQPKSRTLIRDAPVRSTPAVSSSSAALDFLDEILGTPLDSVPAPHLDLHQHHSMLASQASVQPSQRRYETQGMASRLGTVSTLRDLGLPEVPLHTQPAGQTPDMIPETPDHAYKTRRSSEQSAHDHSPSQAVSDNVGPSQPAQNSRVLIRRLAEQIERAEQEYAEQDNAVDKERAVVSLEDGQGASETGPAAARQDVIDYDALNIEPQDLRGVMRIQLADLVLAAGRRSQQPRNVDAADSKIGAGYARCWPTSSIDRWQQMPDYKRFRKHLHSQLPTITALKVYKRGGEMSSDDEMADFGDGDSAMVRHTQSSNRMRSIAQQNTEVGSSVGTARSRKRRLLQVMSSDDEQAGEDGDELDNDDNYNDKEFVQRKALHLRPAAVDQIAQLTGRANNSQQPSAAGGEGGASADANNAVFKRPAAHPVLSRIGQPRNRTGRAGRRKLLDESDEE